MVKQQLFSAVTVDISAQKNDSLCYSPSPGYTYTQLVCGPQQLVNNRKLATVIASPSTFILKITHKRSIQSVNM